MNKSIWTALLVMNFIPSLLAQHISPFTEGDRVVFVGNSITDGGRYHSYLWLYYMTRFPGARLDIFNAGIGGDQAEQILFRFDRDVIERKPTHVFLTFGMNDSGYFEYLQPDSEEYAAGRVKASYENYRQLEQKLLQLKRTKKVLMTSSPYDETTKGKGNLFPKKSQTMQQISAFQEASAQKNHWGFIDLNSFMTSINTRGQLSDSAFTISGNDRIHPDNDGHLIMAYYILKSQGLTGYEVANLQVDASTGSVLKNTHCRAGNLQLSGRGGSFEYTANALPFPVDTIGRGWGSGRPASAALQLIPFTEEMNQEILSVKGLQPGTYLLSIDNIEIGRWTAEEFNKGINLAKQVNTPQYQQAMNILYLNEKRWEIERRFRTYHGMQFGFFRSKNLMYADDQKALDTLKKYAPTNPFLSVDFYQSARFKKIRSNWQKEMDELTSIIYTLNKPLTRKVQITATGETTAAGH